MKHNDALDENFWSQYFKVYDVLNRAIPYQGLLEKFYEYLGDVTGKVLDAGSGTGNFQIYINQKNPNVAIVSLDSSVPGQKIHKSKNSNAEILIHDLNNKLPFQNEYFNGVISNNALYLLSLDTRKLFFDEAYRVLRPGGKIIISNLLQGFKPSKVLLEHLKEKKIRNGNVAALSEFIKYILPTIKILTYNQKIKKVEINAYPFFKKGEQAAMMAQAGFQILDTIEAYAGQAEIVYAKKL